MTGITSEQVSGSFYLANQGKVPFFSPVAKKAKRFGVEAARRHFRRLSTSTGELFLFTEVPGACSQVSLPSRRPP